MSLNVTMSADAGQVLAAADGYLTSEPVLHNLVLSLLQERAAGSEPGRYWVVRNGAMVTGVAFQSPLDFPLLLTPMDDESVEALADAVAEAKIAVPGVNADAATSARFAGQWAERRKVPARPVSGLRLYHCPTVRLRDGVAGCLRRAGLDDRDRLVAWTQAFALEVDELGDAPAVVVDRRLSDGRFWMWDVDGTPVSMATHSTPVAGTVRIQFVYTPPGARGQGYAGACVGHLSQALRAQGVRCILYTELINPTSNSVYRRIGYRAVADVLRYSFGWPGEEAR